MFFICRNYITFCLVSSVRKSTFIYCVMSLITLLGILHMELAVLFMDKSMSRPCSWFLLNFVFMSKCSVIDWNLMWGFYRLAARENLSDMSAEIECAAKRSSYWTGEVMMKLQIQAGRVQHLKSAGPNKHKPRKIIPSVSYAQIFWVSNSVEITCPFYGWPKPQKYNTAQTCKLMSKKMEKYILLPRCAKLLSSHVLNVTFTWSLEPTVMRCQTEA